MEREEYLEANEPVLRKNKFEEINRSKEARLKPSLKDPPVLGLKKLPNHLEYAFLEKDSKLLVSIHYKERSFTTKTFTTIKMS